MVPRRIAQLGRRVYPPGLWEGTADRRWVSLTFDDAPHPEVTGLVLEALRRTRAPAAFFAIGSRAQAYPDMLRRVHDEGHEIGNHTWSHRPLLWGAGGSPFRQVERTEELLARLCPGSPRIFRPPFGAIGPGGPQALTRHGLTPVYWSVVPADWDPLTPETVLERVLTAVHPGAVIVLHCGQPWHAGTAASVEPLVHALRQRGYEIAPLSRMLAEAGHAVGRR